MKTKFTNDQINAICERDGISRKSAIRKLGKMSAKDISALVAPQAPVADVKSRAANDDTNQPAPKAQATPKVEKPRTAVGDARAEGIRLYKLSSIGTIAKDEEKTTKQLFQHVYGERGHLMTWEQRAKVVGLATAEEAAREFARMRGGKKEEFVVKAPAE